MITTPWILNHDPWSNEPLNCPVDGIWQLANSGLYSREGRREGLLLIRTTFRVICCLFMCACVRFLTFLLEFEGNFFIQFNWLLVLLRRLLNLIDWSNNFPIKLLEKRRSIEIKWWMNLSLAVFPPKNWRKTVFFIEKISNWII